MQPNIDELHDKIERLEQALLQTERAYRYQLTRANNWRARANQWKDKCEQSREVA